MIGRALSHYKILSEISRGGMGIVYRAVDVKLDREVALKVLPTELVADSERKRRFTQEAKAAAKLDHPHIGMVFEIDEADGTTFIAMELIRGEQLGDTIAKNALPLRRALEIATDHRKLAEEYARRALEHSDRLPARERCYIEAYYYALRRGTWDRAIEAYQQALRLDPNSGSSRNNMAWRLRDFEHVDEAIEHFEELRRRQWPSPYSHSHLATCYGLKGQFDRGHRVLEEYLRQHPDNSTGYALVGRYLTFWGKLARALEAFRRSESLDPGNYYVRSYRHPLSILLEDWQGAEKDAKWMMTLGDPVRESLGLRNLGRVRLHQGRSKEALDSLDQAEAASADPTNIARSCAIAAYALLAEGELTRALEKAQRAHHEGKNDLPEWQGLFYGALAQARLDRWDDAANSAEELRTQAEALPTEIEKRRYRHLMGELALARGDTAEAIKDLREAESTLLPRWHDATSQHVPIWYSLAHAYLESGDEEGAAEWFQRIVESSIERVWWPIEYVRSYYFLGKIHENRDIEKAREYYRRFYEYWKDGDMDRERVEESRKKLES